MPLWSSEKATWILGAPSAAMVALPLVVPAIAPWLPMPYLPVTRSEWAIATDAAALLVALKPESSASAVVSARDSTAYRTGDELPPPPPPP